ncbi:hypothetical protein CMQ_2118 [Grosmannia clavigera kw1407]|uniref:Uncharacterized protein n=1 Tax=Grosmannia clavigera (strain kw1407 / UAMH 11150) TaxID=655863 RepID=F0XJF4_GROCL|nr:uncharacterized protein CMQ_2118 [Grosmannia clavigera kw1407]EFX02069.1 hypothetical protein CMQ_2118 [Grosmannia clavigera kw1407]
MSTGEWAGDQSKNAILCREHNLCAPEVGRRRAAGWPAPNLSAAVVLKLPQMAARDFGNTLTVGHLLLPSNTPANQTIPLPTMATTVQPLSSANISHSHDSSDEKGALALTESIGGNSTLVPSLDDSRYIAISPYPDHLLDLDTLDPQTRLLTRALTVFDKVRDDYATAPYADSFNLSSVIDLLRRLVAAKVPEGFRWQRAHFFVVGFRSQIPPATTYSDLDHLDVAAHREALASGGLIRYWFNNPDANGRNLATCVWRSQADARVAGRGREHQRASSAVRSLYSEWHIERYRLDIHDDVSQWEIGEWTE